METTELATHYTRYLDALNGARRVDEIRTFHALDYQQKKQRILALMAGNRHRPLALPNPESDRPAAEATE